MSTIPKTPAYMYTHIMSSAQAPKKLNAFTYKPVKQLSAEEIPVYVTKYNPIYADNLSESRMKIWIFILLCSLHIILGLIIGYIFELFTKKIQASYGENVALFVQLAINVMFLTILRYYVAPLFIIQLQAITPGLLFVAMFFGMQPSLYTNATTVGANIVNRIFG